MNRVAFGAPPALGVLNLSALHLLRFSSLLFIFYTEEKEAKAFPQWGGLIILVIIVTLLGGLLYKRQSIMDFVGRLWATSGEYLTFHFQSLNQ